MIQRWASAVLLQEQEKFRRGRGYKEMETLHSLTSEARFTEKRPLARFQPLGTRHPRFEVEQRAGHPAAGLVHSSCILIGDVGA